MSDDVCACGHPRDLIASQRARIEKLAVEVERAEAVAREVRTLIEAFIERRSLEHYNECTGCGALVNPDGTPWKTDAHDQDCPVAGLLALFESDEEADRE